MPFLIWLNFSMVSSASSLPVLDGVVPVVGEGVVFPALSISFWISLGQAQPITINIPMQRTKERAFEFFILFSSFYCFCTLKQLSFGTKKLSSTGTFNLNSVSLIIIESDRVCQKGTIRPSTLR